MNNEEAFEEITSVIDIASVSLQITEGVMASIEEAYSKVAASFGDHRTMLDAARRAHNRAASTRRYLQELLDLAEEFRGLLPR